MVAILYLVYAQLEYGVNQNSEVSSVKPQTERALRIVIRASTEPHARVMATEKGGIKVISDPPESKLSELGVRSWPK
nr:enzyme of the cupin superfamily [Ipomoea batatas]GMD21051.1 enzyme of the cupin superfamily [Ipomoea batatas]